MRVDFSNLTDEELEEMKDKIIKEVSVRRAKEREQVREELKKMLIRINELQDMYDFEISCTDEYDGCRVSSAIEFELEN